MKQRKRNSDGNGIPSQSHPQKAPFIQPGKNCVLHNCDQPGSGINRCLQPHGHMLSYASFLLQDISRERNQSIQPAMTHGDVRSRWFVDICLPTTSENTDRAPYTILDNDAHPSQVLIPTRPSGLLERQVIDQTTSHSNIPGRWQKPSTAHRLNSADFNLQDRSDFPFICAAHDHDNSAIQALRPCGLGQEPAPGLSCCSALAPFALPLKPFSPPQDSHETISALPPTATLSGIFFAACPQSAHAAPHFEQCPILSNSDSSFPSHSQADPAGTTMACHWGDMQEPDAEAGWSGTRSLHEHERGGWGPRRISADTEQVSDRGGGSTAAWLPHLASPATGGARCDAAVEWVADVMQQGHWHLPRHKFREPDRTDDGGYMWQSHPRRLGHTDSDHREVARQAGRRASALARRASAPAPASSVRHTSTAE
jgi:hypothetical protein